VSLQALAAAADGVDLMTMDLQLGDDLPASRIVFNGQNPAMRRRLVADIAPPHHPHRLP